MLDHVNDTVTVSALFQAYYDCRVTKRNSSSALKFEENLERNLMDLYYELLSGQYRPGRSTVFVVQHPKVREVWAADFRDRIVHHLLYNHIADRFHRRFIFDSRARIVGAVTAAKIAQDAGQPYSITWTLADNSPAEMDAQTTIDVGLALLAHVDAIHQHSRTLRQQIDSAQALQALAAVRWDAPTQAEAPEKTDPQPA